MYEATGTKYEGCGEKKMYQLKKGQGGALACWCLDKGGPCRCHDGCVAVPAAALHALREDGAAMLVHGRAVPHTCTTVHQWPQQRVGIAALQPAHSPSTAVQGYGTPRATRPCWTVRCPCMPGGRTW